MLEAAGRGEVADQYAGGNDQRASDIAAGAGRTAQELVGDVLTSAARLEAAWHATRDDVWATGKGRVVGGTWPLRELPFRRWREVELHHVDLGLRYGIADWPDAYVEAELGRSIAGLPARMPPGTGLDIRAPDTGRRWVVGRPAAALPVSADRRVLLAWLVGRGGAEGFPAIGPWTG
jgi:maleylpyruvate isomerase